MAAENIVAFAAGGLLVKFYFISPTRIPCRCAAHPEDMLRLHDEACQPEVTDLVPITALPFANTVSSHVWSVTFDVNHVQVAPCHSRPGFE